MSNLDKVKELRKATGAGFKDCNNALKESGDDIEKAIEILRVKGISKASKKMLREANEGLIVTTKNEKSISLIEINCETDFVAKNNDFINFAKEIGELNNNVYSDINKLKLEKMNNGKTVDENLVELISKIGEKITLGRTKSFLNSGVKNYNYLHSVVKENLSKLSVITSLETDLSDDDVNEFGKQLCMHIAASNPLALNSNELDENVIKKEEELISEELKTTGKSEDIIKKISLGKLSKFKEENSLMTQNWVMEPKLKVKDVIKNLGEKNIKVKNFYRLKIGE